MVEALCGVDLEERDRIREEQASRPRFQENETQEWTKGLTRTDLPFQRSGLPLRKGWCCRSQQ